MRIGYFGGSFDPPHRGHLTVARAARDCFGLEHVLLAPTGKQPLKPEGATASFPDRLRMTELLCAGEPGLRASAVDAPRPGDEPNYTVDTLLRLKNQLPADAAIFAMVGADAFLGLPKWHRASELFDIAEWLVVSRPGVPLHATDALRLTPEQRSRIHLLEGVADPTAATNLRERLREGLPCSDLLPPAVLQYVQKHRLYQRSTPPKLRLTS